MKVLESVDWFTPSPALISTTICLQPAYASMPSVLVESTIVVNSFTRMALDNGLFDSRQRGATHFLPSRIWRYAQPRLYGLL